MVRRALFVLVCWLLALPVAAANHYVLASAAGTGTGADWTNACTDFSGSCAVSSLVRGDTYYVGTGTYVKVNFNKAASGTLVITIKGATVADHGTDTGWSAADSVSSADGGAQASWTNDGAYAFAFSTSYWVFDGSVGSGYSPTTYGFTVAKPSGTCAGTYSRMPSVSGSTELTTITVSHVAYTSCAVDGVTNDDRTGLNIGCGACYVHDLTLSYLYFDGFGDDFNTTNLANSVIEYVSARNHWFASGGTHAEFFAQTNCHNSDVGGCSTLCTQGHCSEGNTVRWSTFKNIRSTGGIIGIGPGNVYAVRSLKVYGNVFTDDQSGNGILGTGGANFVMADTVFYNNTIIGDTKLSECESATPCLSATGNIAENNLMSAGTLDFGGVGGANDTGDGIVHDYNFYANSASFTDCSACGQSAATEPNKQTSATDPFVDSTNGDYHILTHTTAGLDVGSPYNVDPDGVTRSPWDRGAYEYVSGATVTVIPKRLRIIKREPDAR